ncbi:MAG: sporulation membrane protein YtaF [Solirubrobacterales bacterium]
MNILSIIMFAIASSSDSLIVGLSYGAKKVKINFLNNLFISSISGIGTLIAMLFGKVLLKFIPVQFSNILGSSILILFAVYLLFNFISKEIAQKKGIVEYQLYDSALKNPEIIDTNNSKTIEMKESVMLGIVLCLNNIGLGIGASITGLNIIITSVSSLIFSLIFIPAGFYLGENIFTDKLSRYSEIISIIIILLLGIYELLSVK